MKVTEVRIKLAQKSGPDDRLLGFATIVLDNELIIRELRVIDGKKGIMVSMPSRRILHRCDRCGGKNDQMAAFCGHCGRRFPLRDRSILDDTEKPQMFVDVCHPVRKCLRDEIHASVIHAYRMELIKASKPGYECTYYQRNVAC